MQRQQIDARLPIEGNNGDSALNVVLLQTVQNWSTRSCVLCCQSVVVPLLILTYIYQKYQSKVVLCMSYALHASHFSSKDRGYVCCVALACVGIEATRRHASVIGLYSLLVPYLWNGLERVSQTPSNTLSTLNTIMTSIGSRVVVAASSAARRMG